MNIDPQYWGESLWKTMYCIGASLSQSDVSQQQSNDLHSFFMSLKTLIPCENCRSNYNIDIEKTQFPTKRNKTTICEWIHTIEKATNSRLNKQTISLSDRLKGIQPHMTARSEVGKDLAFTDLQSPPITVLLETVPTEIKGVSQEFAPVNYYNTHQTQHKPTPQSQQPQTQIQKIQQLQKSQQPQQSQKTQPNKPIKANNRIQQIIQQSNKKTLAPPMSKVNKMVLRSGGRIPKAKQKVHAKMPKQIVLRNKADLRYVPPSQAARQQKPCNCGNKIM